MGISRKTKSVKIILDLFDNTKKALSVVDLVRRFKEDMNKTTVYRILERLEEDGILHSFIGKDGLKWVAKCKHEESHSHLVNHPHFQCNECGKSTCLEVDISIPTVPNHKIESTNVILIGQCEDCLP